MFGQVAVELPKALTVGKNATTGIHVYLGSSGGSAVYAGITNNIIRRQAEHAAKFVVKAITSQTLTRGEARAIEQAIIHNNPSYRNAINSISPTHGYYDRAVSWGEQWLTQNGYGSLVR